MGNGTLSDCSGSLCGYGVKSRADCAGGNGSCWAARIVEARESEFHDVRLQDATRQIKSILEGIGEDSEGRTLSFLHTKMGTMLAWVGHVNRHADDAVTYDSPNEELARTLGLIGVGYDDYAQAS